jgi:nitroimidazol reductase NimA-like FMN-containing flavoprotein (pyridoxamine 5'-phosphate oxidase superfamily)
VNTKQFSFSFVEKQIRKKTFGVLTTINKDGTPHTTGVLYGVSPPSSKFALYFLTSIKYKKARNIQQNPNISFLIPFPHYYIRFAPSATVTIQGRANFLSLEYEAVQDIFSKKRILRLIIKQIGEGEQESITFISIKPKAKILCYGLGHNIFKLRRSHTQGGYSVMIPKNRLFAS